MIRISASPEKGFWRCGVLHPRQPQEYPNDRFTKAQLAVLRAEPMLFVRELPDPEPVTETEKPKRK